MGTTGESAVLVKKPAVLLPKCQLFILHCCCVVAVNGQVEILMRYLTSRKKHICMKPQLLKVRSGQVRASVCFRLSFQFNCAKAWNEFCGDIYLSRFSIKILKNDYSTIFLTVNVINLNVPRHNIVDFSISYVERWLPFHKLWSPVCTI